MGWYRRGWYTLIPDKNYEALCPGLPMSGDITLQIPSQQSLPNHQPITLHWQRFYGLDSPACESLRAQPDWRKQSSPSACLPSCKFHCDDRIQCTLSYGDKPLWLNLVLDHVYISSAGIQDETHLEQRNINQLPCYWLFLRLYQGLSATPFFMRKGKIWDLAGGHNDDEGTVSHTVNYRFDLENLECTYIHYYRENRQN
ncbi:MAG: hypothetical protein ACHWZW_15250 [Spirulina sp.]